MKTTTLPLSYRLPQSQDTLRLGAQLAALCPKQCILFLQGSLGAGKTTFARGFIQQLGDFKRIKSPTYTLVETYIFDDQCILHFDLYRLQNPLELESIGIRDYTLEPAIWLIEWPEQALKIDGVSILPTPDIVLYFSLLPDCHAVTLTPSSDLGHALLKQLTAYYVDIR
jgi:tRNA threonylcarbamoyladenosine biosynthesis protein TsaE